MAAVSVDPRGPAPAARPAPPRPDELDRATAVTGQICATLDRLLPGRADAVRVAVAVLLAEGHLLLEDVPGVGKTTLARAMAASVDGTAGRIQFTPDLLPSDLTGVSIYRAETGRFEFHRGPVFATIVIGDEINRASPKTQSALLECMQERQVTVDGVSHSLPRPFMVVATQNPVEMEGTYPLPEAQRDRFMARIALGYPPPDAELALLEGDDGSDPVETVTPVVDVAGTRELIAVTHRVFSSTAVQQYILDLVHASRTDPSVRLGASPRAAIQLLRLAKAMAVLEGRGYVLPDDVQKIAVAVLAHRIVLAGSARISGLTSEELIGGLVAAVAVPTDAARHLDQARGAPAGRARRLGS